MLYIENIYGVYYMYDLSLYGNSYIKITFHIKKITAFWFQRTWKGVNNVEWTVPLRQESLFEESVLSLENDIFEPSSNNTHMVCIWKGAFGQTEQKAYVFKTFPLPFTYLTWK